MTGAKLKRPDVLLFDVNEALLDSNPLQESIDRVLLESDADQLWCSAMLHYSLVMTVSGRLRRFPTSGLRP